MPNQHTTPPPTHPPTEVAPAEKGAGRPTIHLDPNEWLPYLDDPEATEQEKHQLIDTLWGIVLSFVDLHWTIETEPTSGSNLPPKTNGSTIDLTRALHAAVVQSDLQEKEEA